ncbi:hypothetical protein ACFFGH_01300 [Lysobacter korlensis]|uniref:Lipoprotein n=1 Tax=Lysobacter korlensis TaxID=553636 RepID=A0ABV6RIA2_9GAMM
MPRPARSALLLPLLALAGCATTMNTTQRDALDRNQYAWSAAIRWGDIDGAVTLIDPERLKTNPPSALELERYKQVQISAYRDVGETRDLEAGTAAREVDIGVINRHTQAERTVRYRENWGWDAERKTWWLTSGLPDLWAGQ